MKRSEFFDFLKGICIILVIITHCFNTDLVVRHTYGFAFHVDMSVPLFMIMTGYLYSASFERNGVKSISNGYEHSLVTKRLASYLIPFSLIWAAECVIEICQGKLWKNCMY